MPEGRPSLRLFTADRDGAVEIYVEGEIDAATAPAIPLAVCKFAGRKVFLNLSRVTFLDAAGIRVLLELASPNDPDRRPCRIVKPSPAVVRVAGLTATMDLLFDRRRPPV